MQLSKHTHTRTFLSYAFSCRAKANHLLQCLDIKSPVFSQAAARCQLTFLGLFARPVGKQASHTGLWDGLQKWKKEENTQKASCLSLRNSSYKICSKSWQCYFNFHVNKSKSKSNTVLKYIMCHLQLQTSSTDTISTLLLFAHSKHLWQCDWSAWEQIGKQTTGSISFQISTWISRLLF